MIPASTVSQEKKSSKTEKVPQFTLSKFVGNRLAGAEWIKGVVGKFKGQGQVTFLIDPAYCNNHSDWSDVFSSRLLDALVNNDIL